jgi:hypothetical protein
MLSGQPEGDGVSDASLVEKLKPFLKAPHEAGDDASGDDASSGDGDEGADGEWRKLKCDGGPVLVWEESVEGLYATGLVLFMDGATPVKPEKLSVGRDDAAAPMIRSGYLLLAGQDGEDPHLYDVKARKLLWSSDSATATTFWPR